MEEQVKLLTSSSVTINLIASILDQNNIPFIINNNMASAVLAGFGTPSNDVDLYVYKQDFEQAKEILNEFQKGE